MMDVLSVYERAYDPAHPVVCLDEKSHQLLSVPRGERPAAPGRPRRVDYEYMRHGTVNHFIAVEPKGGRRIIKVTKRRTKKDFANFIHMLVMRAYKHADKVVLVLDNLNTHTEGAIRESFDAEVAEKVLERIEWHYCPKHASWLNMAEIEISILSQQVLKKRIPEEEMLKKEVRAYQVRRNAERATIDWGFTRSDARRTFKLCGN
jgi:hypothetical protein